MSHILDTKGLICPEPVMLLHKTIRAINDGDTLLVHATDPATCRDIPNFCRHLGHTLVSQSEQAGVYYYTIIKKVS